MAGDDWSVVGLEDPSSGGERHWDADVAAPQQAASGASLSGGNTTPAVHPDNTKGMAGTQYGEANQAQRQMTPEELMAAANRMQDALAVQHSTLLAQGPSAQGGSSGNVPKWLTNYMAANGDR